MSSRTMKLAPAARHGAWALLALAAASGCGGTNDQPRPQPDASVTQYPAPDDPGSGPFDCTVADGYEMFGTDGPGFIEDFEFGAATGWYTNNEVCYPWTQAQVECNDAGVVCLPGSQAPNVPACHTYTDSTGVHAQLPPVWNDCYGGPINCGDPHALDRCHAECLAVQPMPPFLDDQLPGSRIQNGGRCGSLYALNIQGGPFSNWGGNVGKRFATPIDASSYDGVAVWLRTGQGYANAPRFSLSDMFTDSQYNMYPPPGIAAYCNPNPSCSAQAALGNSNCYNVGCDTFGAYASVTENWRLFLFSFADMRQGGWGRMRPGLDLTHLLSIQIAYPVGTWDLWVDDIAFYRRKSP